MADPAEWQVDAPMSHSNSVIARATTEKREAVNAKRNDNAAKLQSLLFEG